MSSTPSTPRRILVIANETCAGAPVVEEVVYRAGGGSAEVLVVAPALASSRLGHWLSADMEARTARAQERLNQSVEALQAAGLAARGELGDGDPLQALDDGVRSFYPHEIIISTHPRARSNWLERRVVQRAREMFDLPVTHIVVDLEHEQEAAVNRPDAASTYVADRPLLLFHAAPYEEAMRIREEGFQDTPGQAGGGSPGLLFTERPPEGDAAPLAFAVRVPPEIAAQFESPPAEDGARRFLMPAGVVNRLGPPEIASDDRSE